MEKDDETDEDNESDMNDGDALQGNSVMKKKRVGRPKKTANTKTPDEDESPFPIKKRPGRPKKEIRIKPNNVMKRKQNKYPSNE